MKRILLILIFGVYLNASYIEDFITRLYENTLLREPDKEGLLFYKKELLEKSATSVAKIFIKSKEFKNQNLSNGEYLKRLYKTLLNREPDAKGFSYWLNLLNSNGISKTALFYRFAFSDEFYSLTHSFQIKAYDNEDKKEAFLERFYSYILKRDSDEEGMSFWKSKITDLESVKDIARFFLNSKEFQSKNIDNKEFIKILYKTILDRESDKKGEDFWLKKLSQKGKKAVIESFLNSKEFKELVEDSIFQKERVSFYKNLSWYIQLQGKLNLNKKVKLYYIDLFDTSPETIKKLHEKGKKVMCYFSAGSFEDWREDRDRFKKSEIGKKLEEWEGERWLDIRSKNVLDIMKDRILLALKKGCDGVEADNVNGYENDTGFDISYEDQLKFNKSLARYAHKKGLFIALKNDLDQIKDLVDYFDLAVNEECFEYNECDKLTPFIKQNKPVLEIEYEKKYINSKKERENLCKKAREFEFNTLILPLSLDGSFVYECSFSKISFYHIYFSNPENFKGYKGGVDENITSAINKAVKSVDLAIYQLSLKDIVESLVNAKKRGVKVRVVTDSSNLDWDSFKKLIQANIPVKGDNRSSLMHNKFIVIDSNQIWTGSMNLTFYGAYRNNNNFVQIFGDKIAACYKEEFEELFNGGYKIKNKTPQKIVKDEMEFDIYFAPEDKILKSAVLPLIKSATKSIKFMLFSFTKSQIEEALSEKLKEGVEIKGILDEGQSQSRYSQYANLINDQIDVKLDSNPYKMHHKVLIIDDNVTLTGSYNFSNAAETRNDENSIVVKGEDFAKPFVKEFEKLYEEAI